MLSCFDFVRELDFFAVAVRMVLAVFCGGLIGIEREYKRRPAGFRTHILICLGAAITTLTSQFLYLKLEMFTDIGRLGAQVVAGIGFIIGLVCGAGYVECALFATFMVLVAELLLIKIEYRFARKIDDVNLYVEYVKADSIESIVRLLRERRVKMNGLEITRVAAEDGAQHYNAVITVQISKKQLDNELVKSITELENVLTVEEL